MLTIRRARDTDVDAMHRLQRRAFAEEGRRCGTTEIPPLQEGREAILQHIRTQVALVAEMDGAVVGCVRGLVEGKACTVRALVVEPARHSQGIGSALLRALESEVGPVERIDLTTNTLMEGNVPFYERHGYRIVKRTEPLPGVPLAHLTKSTHRDA